MDSSEARQGVASRSTAETTARVELSLDGTGQVQAETGIGFLDHMLNALCFHAGFDLHLTMTGDLDVDDHHTVEDTALVLGAAFADALGDRAGIRRFGTAYAPLDEALARAVVDISGRPFCFSSLDLRREAVGALSTENVPHFFQSFAQSAGLTLHVEVLRGANDHHRIEAAFKAVALALRQASGRRGGGVPSTKGSL